MAKGRRHVPPSTEVGNWFQHRGSHSASNVQRMDATSTESMLSGPYRSSSAQYPLPPPKNFNTKSSKNYRGSNRFSEHDNRHAFQDHGVYFGDGNNTRQLGRNLIEPNLRHHKTGKDYLKHHGREVTDYEYHSTYNRSYLGRDTEQQPRFRRFPKTLPPADTGKVPVPTTTTAWLPTMDPKHKTDTQVLAVSQEPFLKHNPWKYSFHSKRNVYPPYERRAEPVIDNMFNRYGAAYNSGSNFNSSGFSGLSQFESTTCS